jgi:transposase-like protein
LLNRLEKKQCQAAEEKRALNRKLAQLDEQDIPLHNALARANGPAKPEACPVCWVWDAKVVKPTAINGDNDFDRFRCSECGHEFELPIS